MMSHQDMISWYIYQISARYVDSLLYLHYSTQAHEPSPQKTFINSKTRATWTTSSLPNHLNLLSLICSVWISLSRPERNKVMWTVFKRRKVSVGTRRLCCGTVAWGEAEDTDDTLKLTNGADSLWKRHFSLSAEQQQTEDGSGVAMWANGCLQPGRALWRCCWFESDATAWRK